MADDAGQKECVAAYIDAAQAGCNNGMSLPPINPLIWDQKVRITLLKVQRVFKQAKSATQWTDRFFASYAGALLAAGDIIEMQRPSKTSTHRDAALCMVERGFTEGDGKDPLALKVTKARILVGQALWTLLRGSKPNKIDLRPFRAALSRVSTILSECPCVPARMAELGYRDLLNRMTALMRVCVKAMAEKAVDMPDADNKTSASIYLAFARDFILINAPVIEHYEALYAAGLQNDFEINLGLARSLLATCWLQSFDTIRTTKRTAALAWKASILRQEVAWLIVTDLCPMTVMPAPALQTIKDDVNNFADLIGYMDTIPMRDD